MWGHLLTWGMLPESWFWREFSAWGEKRGSTTLSLHLPPPVLGSTGMSWSIPSAFSFSTYKLQNGFMILASGHVLWVHFGRMGITCRCLCWVEWARISQIPWCHSWESPVFTSVANTSSCNQLPGQENWWQMTCYYQLCQLIKLYIMLMRVIYWATLD